MAARAEWTSMAAIAEYAARHSGSRPADEFAAVELAFGLHLTPLSAGEQMGYASTVAARLPRTFAALAAGQIHPVHVRIIEDETRVLSDEDAARADGILSRQAPGMTFGELRHAAHKLILKLDPEAARKRKEAARGEAQVRRFREVSGNAGLVARELPSDEVLASWQHVEQRALDLRAAGLPGTLQELRVRGYLDLLQERDSRDQMQEGDSRNLPATRVSASSGGAAEAGAPDQPPPDVGQPGDGPDGPGPGPDGPDGDDGPGGSDGHGNRPGGPGGNGPVGPGPGPGPRPRWAEPGRAGHPHHPLGHPPRPVRHSRRGRRIRPGGRRRHPRPGRRRGPPPPDPVVHHRAESRRHRRRPRLPDRPASPTGPRTAWLAAGPEGPAGPGRPRPL